jgi:hypothetical protein
VTDLQNYLHLHFNISMLDCEKIAGAFKSETIKKGEYFLRAGAHCNKLTFIQDGILRIFVNLPDREVTQWISTRESFVTDFRAFFYRQASPRDIQALTDTQLLTIDYDQDQSLGKLVPAWNEFEKVFIGKCFVFMLGMTPETFSRIRKKTT